jgi:hypothetical protein
MQPVTDIIDNTGQAGLRCQPVVQGDQDTALFPTENPDFLGDHLPYPKINAPPFSQTRTGCFV